jgi:tripartite ATP-independent transporter DctP family solute receptor
MRNISKVWYALLLAFWGCSSSNGIKVIKLGHGLGVSHPVHEALVFMAEQLSQKSNGQMHLKIYPNQQLGTERQLLELLQIGSLGMTKVSSATLESFAPAMQVLSLPYLFKDDEHREVVLKGEVGRQLLLSTEKYWLRGLCFYDAGKRSFYSKEAPINTPADLEGQKIRTLESAMAIDMIKYFGGAPTPLAYGELYTALQQGVVDMAENNPPSLYTSRHYEVCKYYSLDEHSAVPDVVIISTKIWNKLTEEQKQWVQESADESAVYQYELWAQSVETSFQALKADGVTITQPDKAPFRSAVAPIYQQFAKEWPELDSYVQKIKNLE